MDSLYKDSELLSCWRGSASFCFMSTFFGKLPLCKGGGLKFQAETLTVGEVSEAQKMSSLGGIRGKSVRV